MTGTLRPCYAHAVSRWIHLGLVLSVCACGGHTQTGQATLDVTAAPDTSPDAVDTIVNDLVVPSETTEDTAIAIETVSDTPVEDTPDDTAEAPDTEAPETEGEVVDSQADEPPDEFVAEVSDTSAPETSVTETVDENQEDIEEELPTAARCEAGLPTCTLAEGETCGACFAKIAACCYRDSDLQGHIVPITQDCEARVDCRRCCDECASQSCAYLKAYTCPFLVAP